MRRLYRGDLATIHDAGFGRCAQLRLEASSLSVRIAGRTSMHLRDARGVRMLLCEGMLWITQDGDATDYVLAAGDSLVIDRNGLTIIGALTDAWIALDGRRARPADASFLERILRVFRTAGAFVPAHCNKPG